MPKRSATSPDGGSSAKRNRGEGSSKRRKHRRPTPPTEPLNLSISEWRWPEEDPVLQPNAAPTVSTHRVQEPGPMTWTQVLNRYRRDPHRLTDVTFLTKDGESVPAHSLILRIRVPYFATLLPGKHASVSTAGIAIDWADQKTLQDVIDVAYLMKTARDITDERLYGVFTAAMHIGWEELETACFEEFQERLTVDNCLNWLEWAVGNKNLLVKHRVSNFAAGRMEELHELKDQELARLSLEAHLALVKLT